MFRTEFLLNYESALPTTDLVEFLELWEGTPNTVPSPMENTGQRTVTYDSNMRYTSAASPDWSTTSLSSASGITQATTEYTSDMDISGSVDWCVDAWIQVTAQALTDPDIIVLENSFGEGITISYDFSTGFWRFRVVDMTGTIIDGQPSQINNPPHDSFFHIAFSRDSVAQQYTLFSEGDLFGSLSPIGWPDLVFSSNEFRLRILSEFVVSPTPQALVYFANARMTIGDPVYPYPTSFNPLTPLPNLDLTELDLSSDDTGNRSLAFIGNALLTRDAIFGLYSLNYNQAGPSPNLYSNIFTEYTTDLDWGPYDMAAEGYLDTFQWGSPGYSKGAVFQIGNAGLTAYILLGPSDVTDGALKLTVVAEGSLYESNGLTVLDNTVTYHWAIIKEGNRVYLMLAGNTEISLLLPSATFSFVDNAFRAFVYSGGGEGFMAVPLASMKHDSNRIVMEDVVYNTNGFTPPNFPLGIYSGTPPISIPDCGITPIDHVSLALSRLVTQFRESTNLKGYLSSVLSEANLLESTFQQMLCDRTIEEASNTTLDIIGALVGQPREFIDASAVSFFGFQGHPQASSFGDLNNPAVGGRFRSLAELTGGIRRLSDVEYKVYIQARTFRNNTSATIEDIISQLQRIFSAPFIQLVEDGANTAYDILIGRILSINEKLIITTTDILPKPAGVLVTYNDLNGPI